MDAIHLQFPTRPGLNVQATRISDLTDGLYPEERAAVEGALERRKWEFATGRHLARKAMGELGQITSAIPRGERREPCWPEKIVGSITHADQWAVASVARADGFRSIGVDLERVDRVGERLHGKLFTEWELEQIATRPQHAALMFSAKEAGYKATYPLTGRYIGFREAEVEVSAEERRFRLRYVGPNAENRIMEAAEGWFLHSGPYVLSLVIIPLDS